MDKYYRIDRQLLLKAIEEVKDSVDTVNMTAEHLKRLMELVENGIDICKEFPVTDVSLREFALVIDENAILIHYLPQSNEKWSVFVFHHRGIGMGEIEKVNSIIVPIFQDNDDENDKYCTILAAQMFSFIQNKLSTTSDDFNVHEKRVQKKSHGKKNIRKGRRKVRLLKTYTLIRENPITLPHGHKKITCPCWGVRGHYRHYKSGKVVFIKPYQKGKNRSNYSPKEYVVFRKEIDHENH